MNMKFNFRKYLPQLISNKRMEELLKDASHKAVNAFFEARRGFDDYPTPTSSSSGDDYYAKRQMMFLETFEKLGVNNKEVRDLMFKSLDTVPEVDINLGELWFIQDAIWSKYAQQDPLIVSMVDNYVDYIIGTGVIVSTPVDEVNKVLEQFRANNEMAKRERELIKSCFIDGEYFALLFEAPKGDIYLRKAHPKTITAIETNPNDIETVYSYKQEYATYDVEGNSNGNMNTRFIKDLNYQKAIDSGLWKERSQRELSTNAVCKMIKLNDSDKLRGLPPLLRVLKFTKLYENFIGDRMTLNHERAKVVWVKTINGRNEGKNDNGVAPRGGSMLVETNGITYRTEKPQLESSEAKEDALGLLYYIGSSVRFPIHILNQRTDQQVYASIKKADTPFAKMIESTQFFYAGELEQIYKYVVKKKIEAGILKKQYSYPIYSEDSVMMALQTISEGVERGDSREDIMFAAQEKLDEGMEKVTVNTEDIPISIDFQQYMLQDPKEMAEVLKIHKDMGIASMATLSTKAGYVWKREVARRLQERTMFPDPQLLTAEAKTQQMQNKDPKENKPKETKPKGE
jgi:hypothetical protein